MNSTNKIFITGTRKRFFECLSNKIYESLVINSTLRKTIFKI